MGIDDEFGMSTVKPTSFYSKESEKTKLNWFSYELACRIHDDVKRSLGKTLEKYKIDEREIVGFSIHISKGMKDVIIQKLSGTVDKVYISHEMVESYFPELDDRLVNKLLDVISKAWDELLAVCEICPTRCISEKDAYCTMFDEGPY